MTSVALEHMVDAMQQLRLGWDGLWYHLLDLNTWLMLRNSWVWIWGGVGCDTMLTQKLGLGLGWGGMRLHLLRLNISVMLCNSWVWEGVGCDLNCCTWIHGWCYATIGSGRGWDVIAANTCAMLRQSCERVRDGVGCGYISCTWTHGCCYAIKLICGALRGDGTTNQTSKRLRPTELQRLTPGEWELQTLDSVPCK